MYGVGCVAAIELIIHDYLLVCVKGILLSCVLLCRTTLNCARLMSSLWVLLSSKRFVILRLMILYSIVDIAVASFVAVGKWD